MRIVESGLQTISNRLNEFDTRHSNELNLYREIYYNN